MAERNYKREYALYGGSKKQIAERSDRNKRRRKAEKGGRVKKGDGNDVHHWWKNGKLFTKILKASVNRGIAEKSRLPKRK